MFLKRIFDLISSGIALVLLSPLLLLISIAIKINSVGPVFYRGIRAGRYGKPFKIFKFRSMVVDAEKKGAASTSNNDMRLTSVGNYIRKFKLDELPQLINVFIGDMSIVGPRPQVLWAVEKYTDQEKNTLKLRPGVTDWASLKYHDEGEIISQSGIDDPDEAYMKLIHPEKMRLQLKYLQEQCFLIDLIIIFKTLAALFYSRISKSGK